MLIMDFVSPYDDLCFDYLEDLRGFPQFSQPPDDQQPRCLLIQGQLDPSASVQLTGERTSTRCIQYDETQVPRCLFEAMKINAIGMRMYEEGYEIV
jgi:hypothetical protein